MAQRRGLDGDVPLDMGPHVGCEGGGERRETWLMSERKWEGRNGRPLS